MKQIHKAAILDFVEKAGKRPPKKYRANFLGPICILEIFRNNPSRGVWLYVLPNFDDGHNEQTEISTRILKRKKIKVFIIRITPNTFQHTTRARSVF